MRRRTFLKVTGMAGILAAHRAPAFAQGTKLHILRWVDFIPACDVELKKQAVEASKVLGAEVQFEFINANDLQPRITAAIQSQSGPDIIHMLHNWPHLYENGLVDVSDLAEWQSQGAGRLLRAVGVVHEGGQPLHGPAPQHRPRAHRLPEVLARRGRAPRRSPRPTTTSGAVGAKLKKKGHPYGQTLGHTFGDAPAWAYPLLWNFGGMETDRSGKTAIDSKGSVEAVKFMQAFWKDACDEGGLAWDDTNNNRAFLGGEIGATLNGASIYIAAKRGQDKIKDDKGEPLVRDIQHARLPAGPGGSWSYHTAFAHGVMKYTKNVKLAKDFLKWFHGAGPVRALVRGGRGLLHRVDQAVGARPALEHHRRADEGLQDRRRQLAGHRACRSAVGQGDRGLQQVRDRRHVRQGRAGHEGRGRREVGRGRAEENLWVRLA